jgi:RNA polymerase sigma-70 factor (ECF subfamily)
MASKAPVSPAADDVARRQVARAVDRLCPSWLASDRDDIIQNTLLRLHQTVPPSEGNAPLAASYIWKTAYTVMIDEIRRRGRRPEVSIDETPVALTLVKPGPSPEDRAAGRELGASIRDCLKRLVASRRAAVVLHLQGHSVPEVATLLGWNAKKTENLVYRALAGLRSCLESKGLHP